jgi:antirestriction protein
VSEPVEPRIYVASLSDYNAGRLHGRWIEANQSIESIWPQVEEMLALSPEPDAEEWAIHDYEGFGPLRLGEYENLEHIATIGRGIAEHGVAFAHWADYLGRDGWEGYLPAFESCFNGHYSSLEAWAEETLESLGLDPTEAVEGWLGRYLRFDIEAFTRDLASDYAVAEDDSGIYVFDQ